MTKQSSVGGDVYKLGDDVSLQPLGDGEGGVVLMLKSGEIYTVNDTTLDFLTKIDGTRDLQSCAEGMAAAFDVDAATALSDLAEIAAELSAEQIIARVA
jgi:pyrroloquinoline quinone biosynthesis protein D